MESRAGGLVLVACNHVARDDFSGRARPARETLVRRPRTRTLVLGVLGVAVAAMRFWPLTLARVDQELGRRDARAYDLVFSFQTGPDNPDLTCEQMGEAKDAFLQTATAIRVGWLDRRCERDHIQLRLTPEGERRSTHWTRYDESGPAAQGHDTDGQTQWSLTVAHFQRTGVPEILPSDEGAVDALFTFSPRKIVRLRGRWIPNEDGQLLQRAAWHGIVAPADRDEDFVLGPWARWRHAPRSLGID